MYNNDKILTTLYGVEISHKSFIVYLYIVPCNALEGSILLDRGTDELNELKWKA